MNSTDSFYYKGNLIHYSKGYWWALTLAHFSSNSAKRTIDKTFPNE